MNTKTMPAWLRVKRGRHRPTVPNHTIKTLARLLAAEAVTTSKWRASLRFAHPRAPFESFLPHENMIPSTVETNAQPPSEVSGG